MHRVSVVAVPLVGTFELSIPDLIFGGTLVDGDPAYEVRTCAAVPGRVAATGGLDVYVPHDLAVTDESDTVIVAGTAARADADPQVIAALRRAAARGARVGSICTGAFVLAEAGLLDGRRATTHWRYADELAARFPEVRVQPDILFIEDQGVLTSAGLAAGIDLCLQIVRTDLGAAIANTVARLAVVAPVRPGGQTQFIDLPIPADTDASLAVTRGWAMNRLAEPIGLADLARHGNISIRTLTRRFRAETGLSPLQWLLHQRIEHARELLESTDLPLTTIAHRSGIGTVDSLRAHLSKTTGLSPTAYRAAFTRSPTPHRGSRNPAHR